MQVLLAGLYSVETLLTSVSHDLMVNFSMGGKKDVKICILKIIIDTFSSLYFFLMYIDTSSLFFLKKK